MYYALCSACHLDDVVRDPSDLGNNQQNENITNSNSEMESAGDEYTNNIEETEKLNSSNYIIEAFAPFHFQLCLTLPWMGKKYMRPY